HRCEEYQAALPPRGLLDVGREVGELLHLAHLDDVAVQHGRALGPLDGFGPGLHLDHPVAAEHLLRLGERAVGHLRLAAAEADAGALGWGGQPVEREGRARSEGSVADQRRTGDRSTRYLPRGKLLRVDNEPFPKRLYFGSIFGLDR